MEKAMSLYEINKNYAELFDKFENEEITQEELQETGNMLAVELQNKSRNIIGYEKSIELAINAYKEEEKRIAERRKALENKLEKYKEYVKNNMEDMGLQKIETPLGVLSVCKVPASLEVYDENLIPNEYKKEKVTISIDKNAIKEALKNGQEVQGVKLVEDKTSLRIK